jgi:hypothetical protein
MAQESDCNEIARRRVKERTRGVKCRSIRRNRSPRISDPAHKPAIPPASSRGYAPPDSEIFELESFRSEIGAALSDLHYLRQQSQELEQIQTSIENQDRYLLQHFQSNFGEVENVLNQRGTEQSGSKMQQESMKLCEQIDGLLRTTQMIPSLDQEIQAV